MIDFSSTTFCCVLLGLGLAFLVPGGPSDHHAGHHTAAQPDAAENAPAKLTVGVVYVGDKDDFGYNQAHADAADAIKRLPGVSVVEAERVPETKDFQQTVETMIDQNGATLIFGTSYGYFNPHLKELARKYPRVTFLHAGAMLHEDDAPNLGTWFAYIDEAEYLCGMAAGSVTKTGKLGYIAAKPITPVLRDINAFTLGARSVNPQCTVTVIFTGDWYLPAAEMDAANTLADQRIDVVACHVDSPKAIIQTAEKRGIFSCGYHHDASKLAPRGYLTGAEWNWPLLYEKFVNDYRAGRPVPRNFMGGLHNKSVQLSPFGPAVSAEARQKIESVKALMVDGKFRMYKGPIKDNAGHVVVREDEEIDDQDPNLWGMHYMVEGVIGNVR